MSVQGEGYRNESFESLEAAVLETQRGRWFLEEYARRQRSAETLAILEILKKLEGSITNTSFLPPPKGAEPAPALKTEQLKFFKQDEEIFVEPTIAAPALSEVSNTPKVDIPRRLNPRAQSSRFSACRLRQCRMKISWPRSLQNQYPLRLCKKPKSASRHSRQPSQNSASSSCAAPQARLPKSPSWKKKRRKPPLKPQSGFR